MEVSGNKKVRSICIKVMNKRGLKEKFSTCESVITGGVSTYEYMVKPYKSDLIVYDELT